VAARFLILVFFFQSAVFLFFVRTQAQAVPCGATYYPLSNHLGSVNVLTNSGGKVVLRQHFLPFGEDYEAPKPVVDEKWNENESWPYGYTGQFHDKESGLIYMHARYYNPVTGHFMSPDSVVPNPSDTYSYDRYAYCRNNPINLTDPTGHNPLIGAVVGAIVGAIMAAIDGQNILVGAAMGALAGAGFGWAAGLEHGAFLATIGMGAAMGVVNGALYGGNMLEAVFISAAGAAIGYGVGQWGTSEAGLGLKKFGQGVLSVLSGGTVGGLSTAAMGGDFWDGFTQGGASAGLSYAASRIADSIGQADDDTQAQGEGRGKYSAKVKRITGKDASGKLTGAPGLETLRSGLGEENKNLPTKKTHEDSQIVLQNKKTRALVASEIEGTRHDAIEHQGLLDLANGNYPPADWNIVEMEHLHPGDMCTGPSGNDYNQFLTARDYAGKLGYNTDYKNVVIYRNFQTKSAFITVVGPLECGKGFWGQTVIIGTEYWGPWSPVP
jgi:RHS repeat-associated protein